MSTAGYINKHRRSNVANNILGGGAIDGMFGQDPDFANLNGRLNRVYTGLTQDSELKLWVVQEAQAQGGVAMANGLFANPTRLAVEAAVNSVNGESGDVVLTKADIGPDVVTGDYTGGGGLININVPAVLVDSAVYTLPAGVPVKALAVVILPELYKLETPVVAVPQGETIVYSGGTDTSVQFSGKYFGSLVLEKIAATTWRLAK